MVNREKVQNLAIDQFFESVFGKHHPYGYQVLEQDFEKINPPFFWIFIQNIILLKTWQSLFRVKFIAEPELLNTYFGNIALEIS